MSDESRFEELLDFPCDHVFKAFGESGSRFPDAVRSALGDIAPVSLDAMKVRPSAKGSYQCVSVVLRVNSAPELERAYAAIKKVEGLKFLL